MKTLWAGPEVDGVTQSLLWKFLGCRERFRLLVVEGLKPIPSFDHKSEFGNMWHLCEESLAAGGLDPLRQLTAYCRSLAVRWPASASQIDHWYNVCKVTFPAYVDYWSKHKDVVERTPLLQEQVFDVPYKLSSGRVVRLRGKWDSVDLIGNGKGAGIFLQENKTKGDIKEGQLKRQLKYDLQCMMYLVALTEYQGQPKQYKLGNEGVTRGEPILGVRYNVVRRPLSGGKGKIRRGKGKVGRKLKSGKMSASVPPERKEDYYARLEAITRNATGPAWGMDKGESYFFMRWIAYVSKQDIDRFRRECLDPILEALCDWWQHIRSSVDGPFALNYSNGAGHHWRHPFGGWNSLNEGGYTEVDEYLDTGSTLGLVKAESLYGELE